MRKLIPVVASGLGLFLTQALRNLSAYEVIGLPVKDEAKGIAWRRRWRRTWEAVPREPG